MNAKQFMELLKNLQKIMKCPACGASYKMEEVQFLGQVDGLFLMQMSCGKCDLPVWMNFMANKDHKKSTMIMSDLSKMDMEKKFESDISSDEMIEFHKFLTNFDGNFKDNLK